jgi:hypothetical protein
MNKIILISIIYIILILRLNADRIEYIDLSTSTINIELSTTDYETYEFLSASPTYLNSYWVDNKVYYGPSLTHKERYNISLGNYYTHKGKQIIGKVSLTTPWYNLHSGESLLESHLHYQFITRNNNPTIINISENSQTLDNSLIKVGPGNNGSTKYSSSDEEFSNKYGFPDEWAARSLDINNVNAQFKKASALQAELKLPDGRQYTETSDGYLVGPLQYRLTLEFNGNLGYRLTRGLEEQGVTLANIQSYLEDSIAVSGRLNLLFKSNSSGAGFSNEITSNGSRYMIVLPENMAVDANLILESSTDLINWAPAELGRYSPATERRFFRLRAIQAASETQ